MSLLFPWKNTNTWVQAQTEATNKRVQISALPYLQALFVLILYAFQWLCQPSQVYFYVKSWVGLLGSPRPKGLWSQLTHLLYRAHVCDLLEFDYQTLAYLLFPLHQQVPLQWRLPPSAFQGPHCICRSRMNLLLWGGGTEPTHKEGIRGDFSQEVLLVLYPEKEGVGPVFLLP